MGQLDSIKRPIEREIADFENHFRNSVNSDVALLNIVTNYVLRRKGKQIRPLFVFLSAKLTGEINQSTYTAATLIELLHTATLIHDDVVDESYERRGFFSVNAIWKTKIAVLVGDYFLSRGLLVSIANKQFTLLESVSQAVKEMSEGELLQLQTSYKSVISIDNYFNIIQKKTASLISACTLVGAQSTCSDTAVHEKLKNFGLYTGIAFQIKDDLLDYKSSGITGKPSGNDIKEKKYTLPLILALKNADKSEAKSIIKLLNNNKKNSAKIKTITDFVYANQGIAGAEKYMDDYKTKASDTLKDFPDSEAKKSLLDLLDYVINREK